MLYRMVDGYVVAQKRKQFIPRPYNTIPLYLMYAGVIIAMSFLLDPKTLMGVKTFKIPMPSMQPVMQPGDMVVAGMKYYRHHPIVYGDIVTFNGPNDQEWVFRVIGLPLDSIRIQDGNVYINNLINKRTERSRSLQDEMEVINYEEELANGKIIRTLSFANNSFIPPNVHQMSTMALGTGEYFLMGDFRDNAMDSRFIGVIRKEDITGKILYSYWGNSLDRINIDFTRL
jgi:signal peptidase I